MSKSEINIALNRLEGVKKIIGEYELKKLGIDNAP